MKKVSPKASSKLKKTTAVKPSAIAPSDQNKLLKKKSKKKKKKILTPHTIEKKQHQKEVRTIMANLGFSRFPDVDGKQFIYENRQSELDDIFFYENIIVLTEYTVGDPGNHLKNKKIIYDLINADPNKFIKFLISHEKFKPFKTMIEKTALKTGNYTIKQLQIRILYTSKQLVVREHKDLVPFVRFFDYSTVKYFDSISKIIKRSAKHEFCHFLDIEFGKIGNKVRATSKTSTDEFSGHILPEEHSSFAEGYKIVSFYIDAESLLKRSYVLRKDGWQNKDNISALYQRMFLAKKIRSMRKYLHEKKRVFVNNIIVTLPIEKIKLTDEKGNQLHIDAGGNFKSGSNTSVTPAKIIIEDSANLIGIVDGQHRSYAYHEGDDAYEKTISNLRGIQNLLVTGILYPQNEPEVKRIKFEAELFLEINSNQSGAPSNLKQEIEFMLTPFSTISISKHVINKLNESGPLGGMFEEFWYEKAKIKTASIISFGLKPLLKVEGTDSLMSLWNHPKKKNFIKKADYTLLKDYKDFCTEQVRNIFIGLRQSLPNDRWKIDRNDVNAILNVTTVNGIINCLRLLVANGKTGDISYYKSQFIKLGGFNFKDYKSSQYRKMGEDIYDKCFRGGAINKKP